MIKLLFICTHNRCRSILAEAVFNHYSNGKIEARSAGSQPEGRVHPLSLEALSLKGISIDGLQSQSWDEHENWQPDIVITVCDSAAGEQCPLWFGDSIKVHWGLEDPSKSVGDKAEVLEQFFALIDVLSERAQKLTAENMQELNAKQREEFLMGLSF